MSDGPSPRSGTIYTIVEASKQLRISRTALQKLIAVHPHYALNGNRKLFSEGDIAALWEAMRPEVVKTAETRRSDPGLSSDQTYRRLQELLTNKSRRRNR